jgi:hypothetical protein
MTRPTAITNAADASIVKGMILRGDAVHDVAAWFGINSGRIANVKNARMEGAKWKDVPPAPLQSLPPPGPYSYFTPRPGATLAEQLQQALASQDLKWAQALAEIREELRTSAHERRQTNEKLDMLMRQNLETGRALNVVENPAAPRPTLRNPRA